MGSQPDLNAKMRSILIDWLIEVHRKFELMPETLYLAVNIVDRFLSLKTVPRRELQLVGISSMLIACKYEEIWAPEVNCLFFPFFPMNDSILKIPITLLLEFFCLIIGSMQVNDFVSISANTYQREQILVMEKVILGRLEWLLTVPTPYVFLVRYVKASEPSDEEVGCEISQLFVLYFVTSINLHDKFVVIEEMLRVLNKFGCFFSSLFLPPNADGAHGLFSG